MLSTNRRRVLALGAGLLAVSIAGCESIRRTGVKFTLSMDPIADEAAVDEPLLDFDHENLLPDEREVLESVIEDGEYTEGYVSWNGANDRTPISEGFKSLILRLADHERSTAEKELGTPNVSSIDVDTFFRYGGTIYETEVTSESAE